MMWGYDLLGCGFIPFFISPPHHFLCKAYNSFRNFLPLLIQNKNEIDSTWIKIMLLQLHKFTLTTVKKELRKILCT